MRPFAARGRPIPAIRDFMGLAENDWDFTDPTAMPGFGALPPGYDIKKMVAQIFGDGEKPTDADAAADQAGRLRKHPRLRRKSRRRILRLTVASAPEGETNPARQRFRRASRQVAQSDFVQRDNNIASHNSSSDDESEEHKNRRQHGGALPQ